MHSVVATLLRIVPEIVIASLNMTGVWWDFTCFSKKKKKLTGKEHEITVFKTYSFLSL